MGAALGWGVVAASSLVLGALLGLLRTWPERLIGLVLAFGAGALISSVRFELFEDGIRVGGAAAVGIGLAAGALLVMLVDSMIPEATSKSGRVAGLATTLGFALAAGLSTASA